MKKSLKRLIIIALLGITLTMPCSFAGEFDIPVMLGEVVIESEISLEAIQLDE